MATLRGLCSEDFVAWHNLDLVDRPLEHVIEDLMGIDQRGVDGVGPYRETLITEPPAGEHFENLE